MGRVLYVAGALVVALLIAGFGYRSWRQRDNALAYAIHTPAGVEEAGFVAIGGIDQWISIRGEDRANPVILFLHGGPGRSITPLAPVFRPWEKHFTVVMWDQRGAGKTWGRNGVNEEPMTIARIVADGIEVAEYLRRRLDGRPLVVLGHSWGTEIGLLMAQARADLFAAYVGTGQVVSIAEKEPYIYAQTMQRLRDAHDDAGIRALEAVGPPPYASDADLEVERAWSERYDIPAERDIRSRFTPMVAFAPDYSLWDIRDFLSASDFTGPALFAQEATFDARECCTRFEIPVFVINGDHDTITPAALIGPWFETIEAPAKRFVLIENGGHSAVLTQPEALLQALMEVRRVACNPGSRCYRQRA